MKKAPPESDGASRSLATYARPSRGGPGGDGSKKKPRRGIRGASLHYGKAQVRGLRLPLDASWVRTWRGLSPNTNDCAQSVANVAVKHQ